jgi:D-xylonolactonase
VEDLISKRQSQRVVNDPAGPLLPQVGMSNYKVELIANAHCETGENPYWDPAQRIVYWTDIPAGRLFRYDVLAKDWERFYTGAQVGGFTLQEDNSLLLFRVNEIVRLHADGRVEVLIAGIDPQTGRFNDVIADPEGRVFAGTMAKNGGDMSGALYRVDTDGTVTKLFSGTNTANGMGFSPDLQKFYWTDTTAFTIFEFDYDRASGEISNRREFVNTAADEIKPDGMTVDREGCVWSAIYGGGMIRRYSPEGELMERVQLPVSRITSASFGGDELRELYITTAGGGDNSDTGDGALYRVAVEAQGRLEFRSRILLQ